MQAVDQEALRLLQLTSNELAKRIVEQGYLNLFHQNIRARLSTPLLSGLSAQLRSSVFPVHQVQAGFIRDDRLHTQQNTHEECQVELCMVQKVIRIKFEPLEMMGQGNSKTGEFVLKRSKFRLEIPFLSIVESAQCDKQHSTSELLP